MDGCVPGDLALRQGARRENILYGSLATSNAAAAPKIEEPSGLSSGGQLAALLLSRRALRLCSFVAPCQPPVRTQRAQSLFMRWVLGKKNQHQEYSKEQQVNAALQHVGLAAGKRNHAYSEC